MLKRFWLWLKGLFGFKPAPAPQNNFTTISGPAKQSGTLADARLSKHTPQLRRSTDPCCGSDHGADLVEEVVEEVVEQVIETPLTLSPILNDAIEREAARLVDEFTARTEAAADAPAEPTRETFVIEDQLTAEEAQNVLNILGDPTDAQPVATKEQPDLGYVEVDPNADMDDPETAATIAAAINGEVELPKPATLPPIQQPWGWESSSQPIFNDTPAPSYNPPAPEPEPYRAPEPAYEPPARSYTPEPEPYRAPDPEPSRYEPSPSYDSSPSYSSGGGSSYDSGSSSSSYDSGSSGSSGGGDW